MKLHDKDKVKLLERVLISVYRNEKEEEFRVGGGWQSQLMRHIRQLGSLRTILIPNYYMLFNRLVWRFVAVACFVSLILVVCVFVFTQGFLPEYELLTTFTDDPDSTMILQP